MAGLQAAGYEVMKSGWPKTVEPGDVAVTWNRYFDTHIAAERFEAVGGTVIVAENGYVRGRHDGGDYYALALHAHNGRGKTPTGGAERWRTLGIDLKPWRTTGDHILVAPNRSFGQPGSIMPPDWADDAAARLKSVTKREIRIRQHPANKVPPVPLEDDLRNCWAVVIWSSSVGVRALIEGIPVICEAPYWVCKAAALENMDQLNRGGVVHRRAAFERLAWSQWSVDEIATGQPFERLMSCTFTPAATLTA